MSCGSHSFTLKRTNIPGKFDFVPQSQRVILHSFGSSICSSWLRSGTSTLSGLPTIFAEYLAYVIHGELRMHRAVG